MGIDGAPFLLGLGCQKGGTTWLHRHLDRHPETEMGAAKEYHYFDARFLSPPGLIRKSRRYAIDALRAVETAGALAALNHPNAADLLRVAALIQKDAYYGYFRDLAARPGVRLVGDVTPAYALLPKPALAMIRDELIGAGFAPRVVYLMRDPVQRALSAVRMRRSGLVARLAPQGERAAFQRLMTTPAIAAQSRYDRILPRIEAVFAPDEIHTEFYETLFTDAAIARLSAFLGLAPFGADFGERVNESRKAGPLDEGLANAARAAYDPVYQFAATRFGDDRMAQIWPRGKIQDA